MKTKGVHILCRGSINFLYLSNRLDLYIENQKFMLFVGVIKEHIVHVHLLLINKLINPSCAS